MSVVLSGPDERDGGVYLSRVDLLELRLREYAVRCAVLEVGFRTLRNEKLSWVFEDARRRFEASTAAAAVEMASLKRAAQEAEASFAAFAESFEAAYGRPLRSVVFDPDTGLLQPAPTE